MPPGIDTSGGMEIHLSERIVDMLSLAGFLFLGLTGGMLIEEELVINPVPRVLVDQSVETISFQSDSGGFRALNQCRLSVQDGVLVIESDGEDPYFSRPFNLAGDACQVEVVHRTKEAGNLSLYWSTGKERGFSESRAHHRPIVSDGAWHRYIFKLSTPGGLRELRIDPGSRPGRYEIREVKIKTFRLYPLEIDRARQVAGAVEFRLINRAEHSVRFLYEDRWQEISSGASVVINKPIRKDRVLERVLVQVECEGLPALKREVYLFHDDHPCPWKAIAAKRATTFDVEICPQANAARIRSGGKTIAALAPLVAIGRLGAPGIFAVVPELKLLEEETNGALLGWEEIRVRLRLEGQELLLEVWCEECADSQLRRQLACSETDPIELEGPVVRVFGALDQGLFAGLEYLGKGEPSSSKADIETEEHIRFAPDRLKVTMPLMAFVTPQGSVAMTWENMKLQPIYATPNFFDGTAEHRMSLRGPEIQATLRVYRGRLEEGILWVVAKRGLPPLPEPPRSPEQQDALCLWALTQGPLRDSNGWGHCVEANWPRRFYVDMVSTIWHLSGQLPEVPELVPNGAHLPNEAAWLLTGRAGQWVAHLRGRTDELLRQQQPDGSFRYRGKFQRGHFEDTASGHCARPAALLLEAAHFLGDPRALEAGVKTLDYMKRFSTPRGAQTWELSLHTPDILASAELVRAYVRGFELTGNKEYLREARRWALSGIPFVYLWGEYPVMVYATIPVYGATHWRAPNWMGLPVQWCGLVYAYAINMLAEYDHTLDWRHLARGILIAGQQMQVPDNHGPNAGLLPDAFRLREQQRLGPFINPCALVSLDRALRKELHQVVVAVGEGHRVVAPFPVKIDSGRAIINGQAGVSYQIVVDGTRVVDVKSVGTDVVSLD